MPNVREFNLIKKGIVFLMLSLFTFYFLQAQQNGQSDNQNKEELRRFAKQKSTEWNSNKRKADSLATVLNIPAYYLERDSNKVVILHGLGPKNKPIYYATDNISAAATISVNDLWTDNINYSALSGEGVEINLWDGGSVRATHQELQNKSGSKIIMRDLELPLSSHSTHIAGTMIATGVNADAKGMAGKATIKAWDLKDDIAEMSGAAADGIVVSNHSYGPFCGWSYNSTNESWYWYGDPEISATEDYEFGFYNQVSADLDYIAKLAPYYLIVKSAGNDRNDVPASSFVHYVWDETWKLVDEERELDGGTDGFDCLTPMAVAKNILTVGAVDDAKAMTSFSAYGPTDDGRVKPDVVANGSNVFSSTSASDNAYTSYSGTSMSTASVTGSVALLHQLQNTLQSGVNLRSSTIKGLLIHSASDLGNTGPDYRFGWGLLNIKEAAEIIYANSNNQGKNIYEEVLAQGEEIVIPVSTSSSFPFLKVTLSWTDPTGQPSSPSLNPRESKLVNDLDVSVKNTENLKNYLPWVLNVENPGAIATKNTNHIDNLEQVYIANPGDNNFNIVISHSGTLAGGSQAFGLVVTGIKAISDIFPPQNLIYTINESSIHLNWNPPESGNPIYYKIYRNGTLLKETTELSYNDLSVVFDNVYQYYVTAVYTINDEKIESLGTNQISVYPQTLQSLPFIEDFEMEPIKLLIKDNEFGWQWGDSESLNCYYLNFSDNTTKFIGIDSYSVGDAVHVSDIAYTAPLRLADYGNITLSFDYLLKTGIYDAIDELHVVYKLQDENEWHEVKKLDKAFDWVHHSFEIPTEICKNGTQFGFYYDDFYQWGMGAGLDNINISGDAELRSLDFTINALISPISSCSFSENEKVTIAIKNIGEQTALPGDSILIQMNCSSGENVSELLVLAESLSNNEVLIHQINNGVDLSNPGNYKLEFDLSSSLDNNVANNSYETDIDVFGFPQPTILNDDLTFCENETQVLIQASPSGGVLSGTGISALYFNPATVEVGTQIITYSVTDENGCEGSISEEIVVHSIPQSAILNEDLTFCENEAQVLIEVTPAGGTLSGTGVSGLYFNPLLAGVGTHLITYSVSENGCEGTVSKEFVVTAIPEPQILNSTLVFREDEEKIEIEVTPSGGVFSGAGIDGLYFDPQLAGIGDHTITYSVVDTNGCEGTVAVTLIVFGLTHPSIRNQDLDFCEDAAKILIEVSPSGGELSGPGVDGLYFDPQLAGAGTHTITYSITDIYGYKETVSSEIVVHSIPEPAILNEDLTFCENEAQVIIEVTPAGGALSGTGVSGLYFNPLLAGVGTHLITYSVSENGCVGTVSKEFVVTAIPEPQILNSTLVFREDEEKIEIEVTPSGGVFSGAGIDGLYFDPQLAGIGNHTITYSVADSNGCEGMVTATLIVFGLTHPSILNQDLVFCEDAAKILIEVSPSGGEISGPGVDGLYFDPQLAGAGTHTITYSITDIYGYKETVSREIVVHSIPQSAILNEDLTFCENEAQVLIEVTPAGGALSGTGVSGLYFNPLLAGEGTHLITYSVSENGCEGTVSKEFVVTAIPEPEILTQELVFREDAEKIEIEVTPTGGVLLGAGIDGFYFDPQLAGIGNHTIIYSVIDTNGCQGTVAATIIVLSSIKCDRLKFELGWNIFSINNFPDSLDIKHIFLPLIDNGSLIKIQDELGNSLEDFGVLGGWQNNIGEISLTEGYKTYVNVDDSIDICGLAVEYPFPIPLVEGWNIMGYPQSGAFDGTDIIQQLIDRNSLIKVQDECGNSIEDWGIFGSWQNNIGNFSPGDGYKVKVNKDDTLWIYERYPRSITYQPQVIATSHFQSDIIGNGVDHMNINLVGFPQDLLNIGDELAVFDGQNCVGSVVLLPIHVANQVVSVAVSAMDLKGMPGFEEDNEFTLKLWKVKESREFILEPEIIMGYSIFKKHETTMIGLGNYVALGLDSLLINETIEVKCYPNPFSDEITIEISLAKHSAVAIDVLNQNGQRVKLILENKQLTSGIHNLVWNGRDYSENKVSPGVYYIRVSIKGKTSIKKIVLYN